MIKENVLDDKCDARCISEWTKAEDVYRETIRRGSSKEDNVVNDFSILVSNDRQSFQLDVHSGRKIASGTRGIRVMPSVVVIVEWMGFLKPGLSIAITSNAH